MSHGMLGGVPESSEADPLIYGMTRALFNPANYNALAQSHPSARAIALEGAADNPPAADRRREGPERAAWRVVDQDKRPPGQPRFEVLSR